MTIKEAFKKYFVIDEEEFSSYIDKFQTTSSLKRLYEIMNAIVPYCDKYLNQTDDKLKRKVGHVLLSRLDYSSFGDADEHETFKRLDRLFSDTTKRNINPYKIIYCSVLTDGNLKNDYEENTKYPTEMRNFVRIYNALQEALKLSEQEAADMFEKCSTLISKVYANRIPDIYNCMRDLTVYGNHHSFRIFNEKEVREILKINPSLFTISNEKLLSAYAFVKECSKTLANQPHKRYYDDKEMDFLYSQALVLRQWLKNNSTLLSMNAEIMQSKYDYLMKNFGANTEHNFAKQIDTYFHNPVTLSIINQMPFNEIKNNAVRNVSMLELLTSKENIDKYLLDNPHFLAMPVEKINEILTEIRLLDETNDDVNFLQTFLDSGKSLFKSTNNINVEDVLNKVKTKTALPKIDVENINGVELLDKFCEVFNKGDRNIADTIKNLIEKKDQRQLNSEKEIRVAIRSVGENIRHTIPNLLKDEKTPRIVKANSIQRLVPVISSLQEKRYQLANTRSIYQVEEIEKQNSVEIENALNIVREIYELKKDKVNDRYIGGDVLYEKLMEYLGKEFDDKKSIDELFHEDVTEEFKKLIVENFNAKKTEQVDMFKSQGYHVPKAGEKDGKIYSALKKVGEQIHAADSKFDIDFEK